MPRPTSLSALSLSDLHRELARRGKQIAALRRRRDALLKKVAALDAQIGDEPSTPVRRGPGRPKGSKNRTSIVAASSAPGSAASSAPGRARAKNSVTLADALAAALKGKTMGIAEAAQAIRKAGYKSNAASFRIMINGALSKKPFKRVSRGKYTVA